VPEHVRKAAERARAAAALRAAHEAAVASDKPADAALLAAYLAYIKLEQTQGDPARVQVREQGRHGGSGKGGLEQARGDPVSRSWAELDRGGTRPGRFRDTLRPAPASARQVLFERAVAAFPVTAELWQQYTAYLERHIRIPVVVDAAYARAVRNCPWVGSLWARAMRALERGGASSGASSGGAGAAHEALYKAALAAGMQVGAPGGKEGSRAQGLSWGTGALLRLCSQRLQLCPASLLPLTQADLPKLTCPS
jgi:hypothetical protein